MSNTSTNTNLNVITESGRAGKGGSVWQRFKNFREANLVVIIIAISIIMTFASPYFATWENIRTILLSFSTEGIVAIGMTVMLVVGGIDISVGSVMCFAMVLTGALFLGGMNPWLASLLGIAASGLIGLIIGLFVTKFGLNFFIMTMAVMGIMRGACLIVTKGTPLSLFALPKSFKFIGQGAVLGVPFAIILFFIIVIIMDYLMRYSTLLRKVFYTGSNEKAAIFSGINVNAVKIWVSILCSGLTGVAGIIFMARFGAATPVFGSGLELTAISAAVIGGASMTGGKGTVFGAVLGIALLSLVTSSLILLNVNTYWQDTIKGLILLFAITFDTVSQKNAK